ncbi:hypothetical protein [Parabacteroides pacaensis]|uniref:hypothetical protein n=1 Tax=Parabacteroides pacaensis TaxID=2086575 RepID=UPI00131BF83F|nr:hypothetical protein [Parabacteroides pacaensis]
MFIDCIGKLYNIEEEYKREALSAEEIKTMMKICDNNKPYWRPLVGVDPIAR